MGNDNDLIEIQNNFEIENKKLLMMQDDNERKRKTKK